MGFFGDAVATTFAGEVTLPPSVGLEIVKGKSFDPVGSGGVQVDVGGVQVDVGGVQAGGAGKELLPGAQVMETGGVEG
jgi:hypothetical protein